MDVKDVEQMIDVAGYAYDPRQDIFYSKMNAWQRNMGYLRIYDIAAVASGMIIDCEPINFMYAGKSWLIEFWKGQYGMTTGCEIGLYNTEVYNWDIADFFQGTFYHSVSNSEMLPIAFSLKKNGTTLFSRRARHWWLTGFRLGEFSEPWELVLDLAITMEDAEMTNAFFEALLEAGYMEEEISIRGNTVSLVFDKPRTPQPFTRIPITDWFTQRKNERLCKKYQEITGDYETMPEKIEAILDEAPYLIDHIIDLGKVKEAFEDYNKTKKF